VAIAAFFLLYDFPDTASFLTIEERAWVVHRLKYQGSAGSGRAVAESESFQWSHVRAAFTDWQIYVGLLVSHNLKTHFLYMSLLIPTDVLGHSVSFIRHITLPPEHHQWPRILLLNRSTLNRPYLYHSCYTHCYCSVLRRSLP